MTVVKEASVIYGSTVNDCCDDCDWGVLTINCFGAKLEMKVANLSPSFFA